MKSSRKIIAVFAAMSILMSGCERSQQDPTGDVSETASPEQVTSAVQTAAVTEKPKQKIKPLSASSRNGYYEDDNVSVTAELYDLMSSLYYPDIVHDMGANPDLFVVTVSVRVRNMTYEDISFDCSGFSLTDGNSEFYLYGSDFENMEKIKSGKTESAELKFLCTLEQASNIESVSYNGTEFDMGEDFLSEEIEDIIDIQSADDVREYLYRRNVIHGHAGYYRLAASPTTYEMHHIKSIRGDDKKYISVTYTAYNRSDYAQLIEPKAFTITCSNGKGTPTERAEPLYISTDKKYMYSPKEADIQLDGTGTLYDIPDFICTDPDGETEFTIIYDAKDKTKVSFFSFRGTHDDEPYYSEIQVALGFENGVGEDEQE